ncbi:hypothetical protein TRFO_18204 [Tritrichomonas foetus]|uniref:IQ calmodulin-binding motif family protein n=1 Tax=Tritrichomonas foetus TaxID=1144522 RepID=A0A1J4KQW3_9EUKA|nr:hypothetical protein TRFO_18204 [Tritrichomonas foetus]|eukprot:OHT12188.1 hypothetical protein TRFO_18204 [Tritrichomonas foetus]
MSYNSLNIFVWNCIGTYIFSQLVIIEYSISMDIWLLKSCIFKLKRFIFSVQRSRKRPPKEQENRFDHLQQSNQTNLINQQIKEIIPKRDYYKTIQSLKRPLRIHTSIQLKPVNPFETSQNPQVREFVHTANKFEYYSKEKQSNLPLLDSDKQNKRPETTVQVARNYIHHYVYSKTFGVNAKKIQVWYRIVRARMRWHFLLSKRARERVVLQNVVFLSWRSLCENDTPKLEQMYNKFHSYATETNFAYQQNPSPFPLYYKTGLYFYPHYIDCNNLYNFPFFVYASFQRRILQEWLHFAKFRIKSRSKNKYVLFTIKKQITFSPVYHAFQVWHRFTRWRKNQKVKPSKTHYLKLNDKEVNIKWNILEQAMNSKESRKSRADAFFLKNLKYRGFRAIHTLFITSISSKVQYESSGMFREHHLQLLAHKAWTRYIQIRLQQKNIERDVFRAWYTFTYKQVERKTAAKVIEQNTLALRIMNEWFKIAQIDKLNRLRSMLKIQQNYSLALSVYYSLSKQDSLQVYVLCFRRWIQFVRARHRWKMFSSWCENVDNSRELAHRVLCELSANSHQKPQRSLYNTTEKRNTRYLAFSIELTIKESKNLNFEVKRAAQLHWNFLTEQKQKSDHKSDALARAFALRINQIKPYETWEFEGEMKTTRDKSLFFERMRTKNELEDQLKNNLMILKSRMSYKRARDTALMANVSSHLDSIEFQSNILPNFTTDHWFSSLSIPTPENIDLTTPIQVFPELDISINEEINQIMGLPDKIKATREKEKKQILQEFAEKMRPPNTLNDSKDIIFENILAGGSKAIKTNQESSENYSKNNKIMKYSGDVQKSFNTDQFLKYFNGMNFIKIVTDLSYEEMKAAFSRFFQENFNLSFAYKDNEVIYKPDDPTIFEELEQFKKHGITRNINAFIAEMCGLEVGKNVPKMKMMPFMQNVISVILSIHKWLQKTPFVQYIPRNPFSDRESINGERTIESRMRVWNIIKQKFPAFEIPGSTQVKLKTLQTISALNLVRFDEFSQQDAYFVSMVLPHIISVDSVVDFVREEFCNNPIQ